MKVSAAIGALALSAGAASAADLPIPYTPPVSVGFDWTGFYIGGHAGCSDGCSQDPGASIPPIPVPPLPPAPPSPPPPPPIPSPVPTPPSGGNEATRALLGGSLDLNGSSSSRSSLKGFIGGVHAGYDYQFPNRVVLGLEGDLDYTDMKASASVVDPPVVSGFLGFRTSLQGSFRGRVGYAFDRLLLYGTGGLAVAEGRLATSSVISGGVALPNVSSSNTHLGWTVGGGAEYAFTNHWLARVELRYTDFQRQTYAGPVRPISAGWHQVSSTFGISYKF